MATDAKFRASEQNCQRKLFWKTKLLQIAKAGFAALVENFFS